jgi:GNAT superfamily N-acetyltransferase
MEFTKMDYEYKYRQLAKALYDALREDPFYSTMAQSIENCSPEEGMLRYLDYSIQEASQYGELLIPEDHEYGVSVWSKPLGKNLSQQKHQQKKHFLKNHLGTKSSKTYGKITAFMSDRSAFLISNRYWYLSIVGILPEFQGRGFGADLVMRILQKTDAAGIPTYLETFTPRNITFYQRLGYQVIDSFVEPTTAAEYWIMSRAIS